MAEMEQLMRELKEQLKAQATEIAELKKAQATDPDGEFWGQPA